MKVIDQKVNEDYAIYQTDCIEFMSEMKESSVDMAVFSPPFSQLYIYSEDIRDMGNCKNDAEFFTGFNFFVNQLYRVLKPGRLAVVHCKQLVNYKNADGKTGIRDFRGDIIRAFTGTDISSLLKAKELLLINDLDTKDINSLISKNQERSDEGWSFHSEVTIWKCPVIEMQRTKTQRLLHKQIKKDSSLSGIGLAEYFVLFRKWGEPENEIPITHTNENFPVTKWQDWASPVWMDIAQTKVLNKSGARNNDDEKHICPFQLDLLERAIELWSNPGEVVFDPFSGIGSTGYMSLKANRKFIGTELKESYYKHSIKNFDAVRANKGFNLYQNR